MIELLQHVLTVSPTGRVKVELSAKTVVVLGKVSGEHPGERAGEHRRDRLSRRCEISVPRLFVADGAHLQGRVDV